MSRRHAAEKRKVLPESDRTGSKMQEFRNIAKTRDDQILAERGQEADILSTMGGDSVEAAESV